MIVTLTATRGEDCGKTFRLVNGEVAVLGRSSQADLILRDEGVSRRHCRIEVRSDATTIGDMNFKNGTTVNGLRICDEVQLRQDDIIELGRTALKVGLAANAATTGKAPPPAEEEFDIAEEVPLEQNPDWLWGLHEETDAAEDAEGSSGSLMDAFEDSPADLTFEDQPNEEKPKFAIQPIEDEPRPTAADELVGVVIAASARTTSARYTGACRYPWTDRSPSRYSCPK